MTILAVDQPQTRLDELGARLSACYPDAEILKFSDEMLAFQYLFDHPVDAVYTAIHMKRLSGFDLARMSRMRRPNIRIFFLAQDDAEEMDALRAHIDGYLIRPVTEQSLRMAAGR